MALCEDDVRVVLERTVRRERGRLIANLVHRLGAARIDLAEDVTQEAVLAALAGWSHSGLPDQPGAWLRRVARNKAIDRLRREGREIAWAAENDVREAPPAVHDGEIADPELRLLFLICQNAVSEMDRLALMLKIVSGFTARQTAALFLESETAMSQRMARAKRKLRRLDRAEIGALSLFKVDGSVDTVLKGIYLMFALGYAPRQGDTLMVRDVAYEALRLVGALLSDPRTCKPHAHALAALCCFHAARFDARQTADGAVVLLEDQDRSMWDRRLIDEGLGHLRAAQQADAVSRYHLEAGIAAGHALAPSWAATNWADIVALYRRLVDMTGSPVVSVNYAIALKASGDIDAAHRCLEDLRGDDRLAAYAPYHLALGDVLEARGQGARAGEAFRTARACGASMPVLRHLDDRLAALS